MQKDTDKYYMMECLSLAQKGGGAVNPNPMVGAVIVKNGKIISKGYHRRFGGPHAEVDAIRRAKSSLRGTTVYVNLEPCCYQGKTPPCTDILIEKGIKRVVVGMTDPNPKVNGRGIRRLRKAGIEVTSGTLGEECRLFNETFAKYITAGTPFVTLKIAQTLDGKIADSAGNSKWITNEESRKLVHSLRARYDAVLVGSGTVNTDDPRLDVRRVKGRNPIKVIIDGKFSVRPHARIFSRPGVILFVSRKSYSNHKRKSIALLKKGVGIIAIDCKNSNSLPIKPVLKKLGSLGISSLLVEGGAATFSRFLDDGAADKILIIVAPKLFGKGLSSFSEKAGLSYKKYIYVNDINTWKIGDNIIIEGYFKK